MNTYADMVTLLLTFFAVMLSFSSVNEEKFNAFIQSLQTRFPDVTAADPAPGHMGPGGSGALGVGGNGEVLGSILNMEQLFYTLDDYVKDNGMEDDIQLIRSDNVLYIRFNNSLLFKPDSSQLQSASLPVLERVSAALMQCEGEIAHINVCGYTASVDDPNYGVSSWKLSGERAGAVASYLDEEQGFPADKLIAMGYGTTNPVAGNDTPEGRQANRRVELVVIGDGLDDETLRSFYDSGSYPTFGGAEEILDPDAPSKGSVIPGGPAGENAVEKGVSPYED